MEVTEVKTKLVTVGQERLRAFCTVTFDDEFVVRDLKVVQGTSGPFVAMPSRKLTDRCTKCGEKNHLRAKFCNECGGTLSDNRAPKDNAGRSKLHADIAHPINSRCRERIQKAVIEAYQHELDSSQSSDYRSPDIGEMDHEYGSGHHAESSQPQVSTDSDQDDQKAEQKEDHKDDQKFGEGIL